VHEIFDEYWKAHSLAVMEQSVQQTSREGSSLHSIKSGRSMFQSFIRSIDLDIWVAICVRI
jgi:hypothetical protein